MHINNLDGQNSHNYYYAIALDNSLTINFAAYFDHKATPNQLVVSHPPFISARM